MNQKLLARWVQMKHDGQVKKYSGRPYFTHLKNVADLVRDATEYGYEIGLCHDLLEDTATTPNELTEALLNHGYPADTADYITSCVEELTDKFTASAYPHLSREARKEKEDLRLLSISVGAQTVKYGDLIDNLKLVIEFDPEHARQYIEKKRSLLAAMDKGDRRLRQGAFNIIHANYL